MPLYFPERTSAIHFDENLLVKLTKLDFKKLTQLEYLSLRGNKIREIEEETFHNSRSLQTIRLSKNRIENIPRKLFHKTRSLEVLDLSMNFIKELKVGLFPSKNNIKVLSLRLNRLKALQDNVFVKLQNLQYLYLDSNRLRKIESKVFSGLGNLKVLSLQNNNIQEIEPGAFDGLRSLEILDLSNNHFERIPEDLFSPLQSLKTLKVDHFTLCCYAEKAVPGVSCTSLQGSGLSSCDELLKNTFLKYFIWVFGALACAGNLGVVLWRIIGKDKGPVNSFLLTNLAVADFLMGVYMLMIAYKDTAWRGVYFKHDVSWRGSTLCSFAGVLSILSSEVSVLTLCMVTLDRIVCIVFTIRFQRISIKKAVIIMIFVWLLGLAISVAPLLNNDYFYDYERNVNMFGRSGVCLPLQLSVERLAGWEYSVVIFIFLNGISFFYMLVAYVIMYRTIVKSARAARSTRTNKESTIAKRMMFIILTDFFCWFPVIVISILCLTGDFHDPKKQVYAWIAVFVLPINSSINPFLYTFSTPLVRDKIATLWPFSAPAAATQRGNAQGTPRALPKRHCVIELKNKALIPAVKKEVVETTSNRKYCIKLLENVKLFGCEEKLKKSFLAVEEVNGGEELRLVDVYKNDDENAWRNTKSILSSLCSDGGHRNVLAFLWSGEADKTSCVRDPELPGTSKEELEYDDFLIVYKLPSTQTLPDFLEKNDNKLTGNMVVTIAKDLIEAISHLSSKQIVHNALLPQNILIADNMQNSQITAILGGLSAAKFVTSSDEDGDVEQGNENHQNLEELSNDVEAFGYILQMLLGTYFGAADLRWLHDMTDSCFIEDRKSRPTALELSIQIELVDLDYGYWETSF